MWFINSKIARWRDMASKLTVFVGDRAKTGSQVTGRSRSQPAGRWGSRLCIAPHHWAKFTAVPVLSFLPLLLRRTSLSSSPQPSHPFLPRFYFRPAVSNCPHVLSFLPSLFVGQVFFIPTTMQHFSQQFSILAF